MHTFEPTLFDMELTFHNNPGKNLMISLPLDIYAPPF
jgi:hypothetical protein